ncbi:lipoate protein ligase C-terminal domain-containing protein [uncultured Oscillibacter sp.]|uniref:lipoate protein ligase C-terminal domain-containing protein n=1 Tax=uncultured Oscillibacter sp. TaxID=876091 RepID=UPI00345C5932
MWNFGQGWRRGGICEIAFYGDFLALSPLDPLERALEGCPFSRDAAAAVLTRFDLPSLFGGVGQEELLDVMFCIS